MFTARYELSPYIALLRFVLKGLSSARFNIHTALLSARTVNLCAQYGSKKKILFSLLTQPLVTAVFFSRHFALISLTDLHH